MKRILALILLAACALSLCSCGSSDLKEFAANLAMAEGTETEATITIVTPEGEEILNEMTFFSDPNEKKDEKNSLLFFYYNTFLVDEDGYVEIPEEMGTSEFAAYGDYEEIELSSLSFNKKYFKDKEYTIDAKGNFSAVVVNTEAFFGVPVGTNEVEIEIIVHSMTGGPRKITMNYIGDAGNEIEIKINYGYD